MIIGITNLQNKSRKIQRLQRCVSSPEYDLYIEIKGIYSDRDICKWEQFLYKLDIYDSKDLYELGILSKLDERFLVHEKFRIKHIQI